MAARTQSIDHRAAPQQPARSFDRNTAIAIGSLAVAILVLIALIGLITWLPAQTIARTISTQASEQQRLLDASLARQMESYFNSIAYDLIGLANRPEIKSTTKASRPAALAMMADLGKLRQGQIKSIVRFADDGTPLYAWPDDYNNLIAAGQPLPWSVTKDWVDNVVARRTVQFTQERLTGASGVAYLLVTPVTEGTNVNEALAIEIDLNNYFETNFRPLRLSASSQLWVFDQFGNEIFHLREAPTFRGDINQVRGQTDTAILTGYPSEDREAVIAPVHVAFTGALTPQGPLSIVLSRTITEGQQEIFSTLQSLFVFGLVIIGFIVVFGVVIGRFLVHESRRRRHEEQRRSMARTLLEMSRALNSSLELNTVLQRILGELGTILAHDSASIMLFNAEERTFTIAAVTGEDASADGKMVIPMNSVRGAREVVMTGKPTLINDCLNDPRWKALPGTQTRSWLGVPMRVRDESVGVLNINSYVINRFLPDDIDLAEAFADQAGVAIQNARAHEYQIRVYETELETARAIQTSLLPQEQPPVPQLELAARAVPARQVSGDYYQYYLLPDGRLGIAVGDVSGKGIPAALLMAVITTALRDEILRTQSAAALLNELNSRLLPRMQQNNMNSALLMSIFDPQTRRIELANAGMVQPYVRNGTGWDFVAVGGYPLGASSRMSYAAKTVTLIPGSMLVFVTDGVIECQNGKQEFFGFERLEALLAGVPKTATADQVADIVLAAVEQHLDGLEPQDDITVVVARSLEI